MLIRVILVDDHDIVRKGLIELLEKREHIQIIGEASDGRTAIELVKKNAPDVVLLDIGMKNLNGIETTSIIKNIAPDVKVLILSMYSTKNFVHDSLKAGASGYLLKKCTPDELCSAISSVAKGKTYLSPDIAHLVVEPLLEAKTNEITDQSQYLTNKEREIIQLVAEGYSRKQMAKILDISDKTVYNYINIIMKKLGIYSIAELTKFAIREGITELDT